MYTTRSNNVYTYTHRHTIYSLFLSFALCYSTCFVFSGLTKLRCIEPEAFNLRLTFPSSKAVPFWYLKGFFHSSLQDYRLSLAFHANSKIVLPSLVLFPAKVISPLLCSDQCSSGVRRSARDLCLFCSTLLSMQLSPLRVGLPFQYSILWIP